MWVRFLLPLFLINKKKIYNNRHKNILINFKNKKKNLKTSYFSFKNLFFISKPTDLTFFTYTNEFSNKNLPLFIKYFFDSFNPVFFYFKYSTMGKIIFLNSLSSLLVLFNLKLKVFFHYNNINFLFSFFFFNNNFNIFSLKNNFYSKITTFNKTPNFNFIFFNNRLLNKTLTPDLIKSNFINKINFIKEFNLRKFPKKSFLIKLILDLRIYFLLTKKLPKLIGNFFKIKKED